MTNHDTYDALLSHFKKIAGLTGVAHLMAWDQEVLMPPKGAPMRAEQAAMLEAVIHEKRTDGRIADWLAQLEGAKLTELEASNIRLIKRSYERAIKIPTKLAEELARVTAQAQAVWVKARADNRFVDFAPELDKMIKLKRAEADCIASQGASRYDALLNDYEPGMRVTVLKPLLERLRPRLVVLRDKILNSSVQQPQFKGRFDVDKQMKLTRVFGDMQGYDWQGGRIDLSTHPFCVGMGGDVRITTRVNDQDPFFCFYATIHEIGHALYEQGIPQEHGFTPVGSAVSMGVHESQARFWENQVGRSRAFCSWFFPHFKQAFPDCGVEDAESYYRAVNLVEEGFIRTETDEVQYNLHVLMRFELEYELVEGQLDAADMEVAWNERFKRDFGRDVPDAAHGVLQDMHWGAGLVGYFPTYSLGNIYAAQLNEKIREDLTDINTGIAQGETAPILTWLRQNIHEKGSLYEPEDLIKKAIGKEISEEPLLNYLEAKYSDIFDL